MGKHRKSGKSREGLGGGGGEEEGGDEMPIADTAAEIASLLLVRDEKK